MRSSLVAVLRARLEPTGSGEYFRLSKIAAAVNAIAPPRGIVLDIGGGPGLLKSRLRADLRLQYTVLDELPDGHGRRIVGDLWDHLATAKEADVVVLSDVLEHVADDAEFVKRLARILKPSVSIVVHVPNVRTSTFKKLASMRQQAELEDLQSHPHVRDGYRAADLENLLRETGAFTSVVVQPSMSRGQTILSDLDWMAWHQGTRGRRTMIYAASRVLTGIAPQRSTYRQSGGLIAVARAQGA